VPRLTTAHNYSFNALPVYQFLCDLQLQGKRGGVHFDWGALKSIYKFLPRVEYKEVILSPAMWIFTEEDLSPLQTLVNKGIDSVKRFQSEWMLPRYVLFAEGDNELLIDFKNILTVEAFLNTVKK